MKTRRSESGARGSAALLALLLTLGAPLAAMAQETAAAAPADSQAPVNQGSAALAPAADAVDFGTEDPAIVDSPQAFRRNGFMSALHLGVGWAAVATGLATGIFNPEVVGEDVHATLGITAAALSASAMALGIVAHHGEVGPKFRLSANNVHALVGAAGGVMMMIAPFLAPSEAHQAFGEGGALLMGASVVWKLVY